MWQYFDRWLSQLRLCLQRQQPRRTAIPLIPIIDARLHTLQAFVCYPSFPSTCLVYPSCEGYAYKDTVSLLQYGLRTRIELRHVRPIIWIWHHEYIALCTTAN